MPLDRVVFAERGGRHGLPYALCHPYPGYLPEPIKSREDKFSGGRKRRGDFPDFRYNMRCNQPERSLPVTHNIAKNAAERTSKALLGKVFPSLGKVAGEAAEAIFSAVVRTGSALVRVSSAEAGSTPAARRTTRTARVRAAWTTRCCLAVGAGLCLSVDGRGRPSAASSPTRLRRSSWRSSVTSADGLDGSRRSERQSKEPWRTCRE